jgi:hypothetical protein
VKSFRRIVFLPALPELAGPGVGLSRGEHIDRGPQVVVDFDRLTDLPGCIGEAFEDCPQQFLFENAVDAFAKTSRTSGTTGTSGPAWRFVMWDLGFAFSHCQLLIGPS